MREEKTHNCKIREEEVVQKPPFRQHEIISLKPGKEQVISLSVASFHAVSQDPRARAPQRYFQKSSHNIFFINLFVKKILFPQHLLLYLLLLRMSLILDSEATSEVSPPAPVMTQGSFSRVLSSKHLLCTELNCIDFWVKPELNSKTSRALFASPNTTIAGKTKCNSTFPFHNLFQGAVLLAVTRKTFCRAGSA